MRQTLTKQIIEEMVNEAKNVFFASDRPDRDKKLLREINPFIYLNDKLKVTWGRAWVCHSYDPDRHIIGVDKSLERVKVEGRKSWFILEINPAAQYVNIIDVRDTVSHELAHLLDFRLSGWYIRYKEDHHQGWKDIHRAMGGNGETYAPEDIDLSRLKRKFHNRSYG